MSGPPDQLLTVQKLFTYPVIAYNYQSLTSSFYFYM
jgi:hypothetical protein